MLFAAEAFDTLGENDPLVTGPADLLAATLLDIRFSPAAVRAILGPDRQALTDLLKNVSPELDIWDAQDEDLAQAKTLWNQVRPARKLERSCHDGVDDGDQAWALSGQ
jgi:hypothetical protein